MRTGGDRVADMSGPKGHAGGRPAVARSSRSLLRAGRVQNPQDTLLDAAKFPKSSPSTSSSWTLSSIPGGV